MAEAASLRPDPSARLNAAFAGVAQRMDGLGLVNPALEVEAVGFAPWEGCWLGVMITPWFMNLVLLPLEPGRWQALPVGAKRKLRFPAGVYEFIGADHAAVGEHQACSLFSPMHEFENQPAARLVAQLAREALFDAANAEMAETPKAEPATAAHDQARDDRVVDAAVSKREFLRGHFGGGDADRR